LLSRTGVAHAPLPIGIVLTSFDPGGTERQMTELIARLDRSRFEVFVACFRREGAWLPKVERAAAEVAAFPLRGFASPSTATQFLRFARWCRDRRLAILHACDFYANVFALPGAALARIPLRIGSRRDLVLPGRSAAQHRLQRMGYRHAHRVVANSQAAAAQVVAEGLRADRVVVIPNGIDMARYRAAPHRPARRVVTSVANLRREKGHDVLIAAAARVMRAHPDVVFHLVGGGPMRDALERQARDLGVAEAVRFLGHREDVPQLLYDSDVFVLPSLSEAFPNGVVEAMAAGLPVVASEVGGIPELITNGGTGMLVPPGDPQELATAIIRLLSDPAAASALSTAARATIERRYSFDRMVAAFEALYLGALPARLSNSLPIPSHADGEATRLPLAP
jgi:glycosyltransferase involved in cell wall biosynthesis